MSIKYTSLSEAIVSTMNKPVLSKKEYFIYLKWKNLFYTFRSPSKKHLKNLKRFLSQYPVSKEECFEWKLNN